MIGRVTAPATDMTESTPAVSVSATSAISRRALRLNADIELHLSQLT
jgi:hypothetical protein